MLRQSEPLAVSVYAVVSFLAGLAAFLLPIETKGRSLQVGWRVGWVTDCGFRVHSISNLRRKRQACMAFAAVGLAELFFFCCTLYFGKICLIFWTKLSFAFVVFPNWSKFVKNSFGKNTILKSVATRLHITWSWILKFAFYIRNTTTAPIVALLLPHIPVGNLHPPAFCGLYFDSSPNWL